MRPRSPSRRGSGGSRAASGGKGSADDENRALGVTYDPGGVRAEQIRAHRGPMGSDHDQVGVELRFGSDDVIIDDADRRSEEQKSELQSIKGILKHACWLQRTI